MNACSTEAWVGGELAFRTQLNKPETWYLVDAMEPQKTKARTILTTSPARDVYKVAILMSLAY